uniref:Uncharacterized protein n=1 Tax=Anguilla anguilla TaxID=7936 RepID=A0A0E9V277_ANGAN
MLLSGLPLWSGSSFITASTLTTLAAPAAPHHHHLTPADNLSLPQDHY